jgi:hypothetical protein
VRVAAVGIMPKQLRSSAAAASATAAGGGRVSSMHSPPSMPGRSTSRPTHTGAQVIVAPSTVATGGYYHADMTTNGRCSRLQHSRQTMCVCLLITKQNLVLSQNVLKMRDPRACIGTRARSLNTRGACVGGERRVHATCWSSTNGLCAHSHFACTC